MEFDTNRLSDLQHRFATFSQNPDSVNFSQNDLEELQTLKSMAAAINVATQKELRGINSIRAALDEQKHAGTLKTAASMTRRREGERASRDVGPKPVDQTPKTRRTENGHRIGTESAFAREDEGREVQSSSGARLKIVSSAAPSRLIRR